LIGLIGHLAPSELIHPLIEHLCFLQDQNKYFQKQLDQSSDRIEILEKQIVQLREQLTPLGLGSK
jgi:hypothetical protein